MRTCLNTNETYVAKQNTDLPTTAIIINNKLTHNIQWKKKQQTNKQQQEQEEEEGKQQTNTQTNDKQKRQQQNQQQTNKQQRNKQQDRNRNRNEQFPSTPVRLHPPWRRSRQGRRLRRLGLGVIFSVFGSFWLWWVGCGGLLFGWVVGWLWWVVVLVGWLVGWFGLSFVTLFCLGLLFDVLLLFVVFASFVGRGPLNRCLVSPCNYIAICH